MFGVIWHVGLDGLFPREADKISADGLATVLLVGSSLLAAYTIRPGEHPAKSRVLRLARWLVGMTGALAGLTALGVVLARPHLTEAAMETGALFAKASVIVVAMFHIMRLFDRTQVRSLTGKTLPVMAGRSEEPGRRRKARWPRLLFGTLLWFIVLAVGILLLYFFPPLRTPVEGLQDALREGWARLAEAWTSSG